MTTVILAARAVNMAGGSCGVKPDAAAQGQAIFAGQTEYLLCGSLIVNDGTIKRVLFDGGYASATRLSYDTYSFNYLYYNRDHLGNNREVVDATGDVKQVTNYYPFGAPYADAAAVKGSTIQQYKYNGKELDMTHGLNTYDYGARQYDPILGRWDRMDSMCEKNPIATPYHFCHGNPINRIDTDGKWDVNIHLAKDRSKNGYGVAIVSDRDGQEIFKFIVRAEGIKGHDRMKKGADTPLGTYDIPDNNAWINGGSRLSYGPNERLVMIPESGEILESGRNDIRIHGGRQEIQKK